jgi:hypothetical protein
MKLVAIDHAANTNIVRDMTAAELAQRDLDIANAEVAAQAVAEAAAAKQSAVAKLASFGLTADEIKALVG